MELTFQHMLPNFNECWWDSWILDVAVCNFIGECFSCSPVLSSRSVYLSMGQSRCCCAS